MFWSHVYFVLIDPIFGSGSKHSNPAFWGVSHEKWRYRVASTPAEGFITETDGPLSESFHLLRSDSLFIFPAFFYFPPRLCFSLRSWIAIRDFLGVFQVAHTERHGAALQRDNKADVVVVGGEPLKGKYGRIMDLKWRAEWHSESMEA